VNSQQRVRAALAKQPTDRVPVFMWFHPDTARRLAARYRIPPAALGEAMGNDVRQTWVNNNYAMEGVVHQSDGEGHVDWWGVHWVRQFSFNQICRFPLAGLSEEEVLSYGFPDDRHEDLLALMDPVVRDSSGYYLGCDVSPCVFEMYWRLRGMEDSLTDIAANPRLTDEMFRRCADFAIRLGESACARFPLDWYWTGDDISGQRSMMFSPASWRDLVKPHLARVFTVGKSRGLPVAYHCCGALRPIIPDLIEIGMNVLNPIQANCPGMDALELKREFGRDIAFMGGVDTQELLPHASAAEVRRATQRLIDGMTADGGGYILAASHTISPETPLENIFAMYEVAGISREEMEDRAAAIRQRIRAQAAQPAQ
jgi:uroporphyrinogen decarboxylase